MIETKRLNNVTAEVFADPKGEETRLAGLPIFRALFKESINVMNQAKAINPHEARAVAWITPSLRSVRKLLPKLLARHILKKSGMSHYRVIYVDKSMMNLNSDEVVTGIITLLTTAGIIGNTAIVLDLNIFSDYLDTSKMGALNAILSIWKNLDNPPPFFTLVSQDLHNNYREYEPHYFELFSEVKVRLTDNISTAQKILKLTELKAIEERFGLKISKDIIKKIMDANKKLSIEEVVRILTEAASRAQLDGKEEVTFREVKSLLKMVSRRPRTLEELYYEREDIMPEDVREEAKKIDGKDEEIFRKF